MNPRLLRDGGLIGAGAAARNNRLELLGRFPKHSVGAEIGVWKGEFSREILSVVQPRKLHLVDPWLFVPSLPRRWYGGTHAKSQDDMDVIYQSVRARFADDPAISIHRSLSLEASRIFVDLIFDWVYIDGDHSYDAVLNDLRSWRSKVRPGGYVAGDDYRWRDEDGQRSVERAVREFAAEQRLSVELLRPGQFLMRV